MEKKKADKHKAPSHGGGNPFDQADTTHATVCSGVYQEKLPVAGMTVQQVRDDFASRLDIADNAVATINGKEVGNDTTVGAGEILIFIQQAGEKGNLANGE